MSSPMDIFMQYQGVAAAWAAAVATTSATCVALWLGLSETRRRSEEREEVASFLRISIGHELFLLKSDFTLLVRLLDRIGASIKDPAFEAQHRTDLEYVRRHIQTPLMDRAFTSIGFLGKQDAKLLTTIYSETFQLKQGLLAWIDGYSVDADMDELPDIYKALAARIVESINKVTFIDWDKI